jgi:hypothetical protein
MNCRSVLVSVPLLAALQVLAHAQGLPVMDVGALAKFARDTGMPAKARLNGPLVDLLHKELQTNSDVLAEAVVVKKIGNGCNRYRFDLHIPDLIVSARNPDNQDDLRTGPFRSSVEMNLCD